MYKQQHPLSSLNSFLPAESVDRIIAYIQYYRIHLVITKERHSILGNFRYNPQTLEFRITINGNLNHYEFLLTFLHELAHLLTYIHHPLTHLTHGKEWQSTYKELLVKFMDIFPHDIQTALQSSLKKPAATAHAETNLLRVVQKYDVANNPNSSTIEQLNMGDQFITYNGVAYQIIEKKRKRFICKKVGTKKLFSFSPITKVERYK
ncbi:MAG: hypothetical protein QM528_03205 [Phycisphaerales bacterium]|nr:hypothetical protein [Phycisphaerales bacterium]